MNEPVPKNFVCCPSHCCVIHGCKYGHQNCPVFIGNVVQEYLCEDCYDILSSWERRKQEYENTLQTVAKINALRDKVHPTAAPSSTGIGHLHLKQENSDRNRMGPPLPGSTY